MQGHARLPRLPGEMRKAARTLLDCRVFQVAPSHVGTPSLTALESTGRCAVVVLSAHDCLSHRRQKSVNVHPQAVTCSPRHAEKQGTSGGAPQVLGWFWTIKSRLQAHTFADGKGERELLSHKAPRRLFDQGIAGRPLRRKAPELDNSEERNRTLSTNRAKAGSVCAERMAAVTSGTSRARPSRGSLNPTGRNPY